MSDMSTTDQPGFPLQQIALRDGPMISFRRASGANRKPTLLLLHGISSNSASWQHVAMRLAARFDVVAWDAPGYGGSTHLPHPRPTAEHYALRLIDLLDALGIQDCIVVGHSLGALIGAAFARLFSQKAQLLLLVSPARGYGGPGQREERERVRAQRLESLELKGVAGLARDIDRRLLTSLAGAAMRERVRRIASELDARGYMQAVEMLCQSELKAPNIPVQVFCGEFDAVTTPESCRAWASGSDLPFEIIPWAGHASPIEQPDTLASLIQLAATHSRNPLK